jgi:molybdopterin-containing oxidoreductase family iron-sulfur binding subunit
VERDDGSSRIELPVVSGGNDDAVNRRDFLKRAGFAFAGASLATLAGCQRAPVRYAVAPLTPPDDVVRGAAHEYSSTCGGCSAGCGVVIKNRDGRPIKLEGNPDHPLSRGGLCAAGQASVLGLYDQHRLRNPLEGKKPVEWQHLDQEMTRRLEAIRKEKGEVRFLTGPGVGPATLALIRRFLGTFDNARHVVHDPRSCSEILEAHARTHGARLLPHYHLDRAKVIVGFDADFLGSWISPVEFTAAYQAGRRLENPTGRLSYHVQFESLLTLTGAKADERRCVAPGEMIMVMNHLSARLFKKAGRGPKETPTGESPVSADFLDHLADYLWKHRGRSLILCGSQQVELQVLTNSLNEILGNYGATVDIVLPSYQRDDNDREVETLLRQLHDGKIAALFVHQCNPVHDLPGGDGVAQDLKRVQLLVSLAPRLDETAELAHFVCPDHHSLESWGDAEPVNGVVSLIQPAINPLGNTRSVMESVAAWTGDLTLTGASTVGLMGSPLGQGPLLAASALTPGRAWIGQPRPAYELVREHWEKKVFPRNAPTPPLAHASTVGLMGSPLGQGPLLAASALIPKPDFAAFWDRTLLEGFATVTPRPVQVGAFKEDAIRFALEDRRLEEETFSLILYPKVGMPDSSHAYNAWLQELPDPISKVTWDNYACVAPATATNLGLADGDVVRLKAPGEGGEKIAIELPAYIQAGQHERVVGVALGYGSTLSQRFADIGPKWLQAAPTVGPDRMVGKNAAPMLQWVAGSLRVIRDGVRLTKTPGKQPLASTQDYNLLTVPDRFALPGQKRPPIIRDTTLDAYENEPARKPEHQEDLWPDDHKIPETDPHWGMVIDLSACTGCSACVVACQAENNIPVVGKDEVRRHREMHWLRIDRYYTERDGGVDVAHQPMLCQHCGNAPCETVCPVLATVHSEDGLNQQVYNRCVGTRYCANNCPYKVRRFNWFEYAHDDLMQNLVLNPDVIVRSRGVMEKCTFCVHRIQEAKLATEKPGQIPIDGVIQTACQQSCPANAIVFGNLNDATSRAAKLTASRRGYQVFAELNVRPSVSYLSLVRNRPARGGDQ